jgi:peptidoglycan DL-endopeptidase CwlO
VTDVEISSTARSGWRKPLPRAAGLAGSVVTVVALVLLPSARPTGAAPAGSLQTQAAQIETQLRADQARLDSLDQQYETAQQQLSGIQNQISQIRTTISQDQATVASDQIDLRAEALTSYEAGATDSGLQGVFGATGEQAVATAVYDSLAAENMSTAVDDLHLAQAHLTSEEQQLQPAEAQAQALFDQIAAERSAAQSTTDDEEATLASVKGRIAELVAGEEAASHAAYLASLRGGLGPPPNGAAGAAVQAAESQIGVPYEWGEEDPGHGFDCSGLTQWSWGQAGVSIPRTANDQYDAVARVPLGAMEPGDLVFWGSGGTATHVGIYVGNGDVVDAPSSGQDVQIQPIWSDGLLGAGRP